ncbi:MAG TPA: glycosyltransferase 87 family protein [Vicinamibacteria bacterium]|nr:glycosyltransferase 87 family protein [Vicinamibacteria bacterium]
MSALPAVRPSRPWLCAALVLGLGVAAAPRVYHNYDVADCFLAWARATAGLRPWDAYTPGAGADDCDYPPLVPYLLALGEAARLAAGAPPLGALAILFLKLPSLLAHAAAVPLALRGLAGTHGAAGAAQAALLLALSPAFFVNAALWGQFDVPLTLFLMAAVVALLRDRPVLAGVATGLALATKLLAVVPVPLLAAWVWRRHGPRALVRSVAAGVLAILLLALPHVLAGRGAATLRAYTGAVGYYPYRTAEAYNTWYLLDRYDVLVRGMSPPLVRRDDRPAFGPVTFHQVGLAAFCLYTLALLAVLLRRPTPLVLLWTLGMHFFGFFMLPTQVHQRYIVPAVGLLALLAPSSRRGLALFVGLTATATANQAIDLVRALPWEPAVAGALTAADLPLATRTARDLGALVALVNVALFAWALVAFRREAGAPEAS